MKNTSGILPNHWGDVRVVNRHILHLAMLPALEMGPFPADFPE